ncbi:MAG: PilZ domain-containing protein [Desulfobulbaceae bacterium]|nr:PilZ domain-containing protein [Desulfobulbaceae bacterium]
MDEQPRNLQRRHLIFYLEVYDDATNELLGHLVDLTTKGLKLVSKEAIATGKTYTMRMTLPEDYFEEKTLRFKATSRWCTNAVNPDFYDTGFQAEDLDRDTIDVVVKLIQALGFSDSE